MDWKELRDKRGDPMLKFDDGTDRQMTIHYDQQGNVRASHVKNAHGSRSFVNPSDAFIAAEFLKRSNE
jgi:hypothetical protein